VIYGVEGGQFTAGAGLSPEVAAAAAHVADEVVRELRGEGNHA
jgi:hypothetical protein